MFVSFSFSCCIDLQLDHHRVRDTFLSVILVKQDQSVCFWKNLLQVKENEMSKIVVVDPSCKEIGDSSNLDKRQILLSVEDCPKVSGYHQTICWFMFETDL